MTKDIKDWIKTNAEPDFAKFAASLVPGLKHEMHGVRLPKLRQKAKELTTVIDDIRGDSCEEILLKAFAIGYLRDIEKQMSEVVKFVPKIDNWMVCDSFCGALQKAKTHQQLYWDMIAGYENAANASGLGYYAEMVPGARLYAHFADFGTEGKATFFGQKALWKLNQASGINYYGDVFRKKKPMYANGVSLYGDWFSTYFFKNLRNRDLKSPPVRRQEFFVPSAGVLISHL